MGYALENLTRDWSNVIFSDEKTYQTDRHQKLHVYRPKNSRFDTFRKLSVVDELVLDIGAGYQGMDLES